jgi:hypothetical protein
MTLGALVVLLLVLFVVGLFAYWVITTFFKSEPARTIALVIVGVILLCILLSQFFPQFASFHVWK